MLRAVFDLMSSDPFQLALVGTGVNVSCLVTSPATFEPFAVGLVVVRATEFTAYKQCFTLSCWSSDGNLTIALYPPPSPEGDECVESKRSN